MDHPSVEGALSGEPLPSGSFEWLDDATLRFTPDQPYPAEIPVRFVIGTAARSAIGTPMETESVVDFFTAAGLKVAERLPKPGSSNANPTSAVVVTFTDPVVPLGADASSLPPAFTLQPAADGKGEWLNTSTYIFYPSPALDGGKTYTVILDAGLRSTYDIPLDTSALSPQDWSFTTAIPMVLGISSEDNMNFGLNEKIEIQFNQPMDAVSAEQNISLIDPNGIPVDLKRSWDDSGSLLTLQPDGLLRRSELYRLVIGGFTSGVGGTPLGSDDFSELYTTGPLQIISTDPPAGMKFQAAYGYGYLRLKFSAPLDPDQDLQPLVSVQPAVGDLSVYLVNDTDLIINAAFEPSKTYTLRLNRDLRDIWGGALSGAAELVFISDAAPPTLQISAAQVSGPLIYLPSGQTSLTARATNINLVRIETGPLDLAAFFDLAERYGSPPEGGLPAQNRWEVTLDLDVNNNQTVQLPLRPDNQALAPGLYHYNPVVPALNDRNDQATYYNMLVVSRLQMVIKHGSNEAAVWAIDLTSGETPEDLPVKFYDYKGTTLGSCLTGADGYCQTRLDTGENYGNLLYAVAGEIGEDNFGLAATSMTAGVGPWDFGIPTGNARQEPYMYLYTDRPIYRPGQEVNFRGVLRLHENGRYTLMDVSSLEVQVQPPYNYLTGQQQLPVTLLRLDLSAYGTMNGQFTLPKTALPGYYTISSVNPDLPGAVSFQVAEYKKPEFELSIKPDKTDLLPGQPLRVDLNAAYYFGAPAGNMRLQWSISRQNDYFYIPGGWHTGPQDTPWLSWFPDPSAYGYFFAQGEGVTAPDGTLTLDIPLEDLAKLELDRKQILTIEVTASDESGFPVSARASLTFHPAPFYAGVRPEVWGGRSGEEIGFSIQTVDWQTQPSGNHSMIARFSKVRWTPSQSPGIYGETRTQKELTLVATSDFRTDGLGRARLAFTPPSPGVYELSVEGEGASTSLLVWVGGSGLAPWPNLPNQRLRLESDAQSYQPGQTARLRFANPFAGQAHALVTVERGRVHSAQVVSTSEAMFEIELPITEAYAPNVYAAVTLIGKNEAGKHEFRQGYLRLDVDPAALRLNVEIVPSMERAAPGQDMGLTLRVSDSQGRPVQGEFSLALVDKAVLALANPNDLGMFNSFYGTATLGVATGLDLANASERSMPPEMGRGGGGGAGDYFAFQVRENFKDTALWVGGVETDAAGQTRVDFRLPDNLTTWVADVRGLSGDTRIGEAKVEIVTTKDLLIRPVAPRYLVSGDRLTIGAIVQNNTAQAITAQVSFEAPGLLLDASTPPTQTIDVPANGRQRIDWWVTVEAVQAVDPLFSVEGGGLNDAARIENAPLPVLRYTSPQTFATAGVVAEGGERLEILALPRSFVPTGGELRVQLTPSLAASLIQGIQALETYPTDSTEQILSRIFPNLAAYRVVNRLNLQAPDLADSLVGEINRQIPRLTSMQREDGGFGWYPGASSSQLYLSAYAMLALTEARNQGFFNNTEIFDRLMNYLYGQFYVVGENTPGWKMDQLAFLAYAVSNYLQTPDPSVDYAVESLYRFQNLLSPWAKALLALTLQPGDNRVVDLVSNIESSARRTASGASWDAVGETWHTWSTPGFSTAIVVYALGRLDPAAPLLTDAVRYLVLSRQPNGCWRSSYESAWVLYALGEALNATGDLQSGFNYAAELNGTIIANGIPADPASALVPIQATIPLSQLFSDGPNALRFKRDSGTGRLYYRAFLEVTRAAEDAPPLERGLSIRREYFPAGQNCRGSDCAALQQVALGPDVIIETRLTITVPEDMYFVSVEDNLPAGVELINPNLNTSRRAIAPEQQEEIELFDLRYPFESGFGGWLFGSASIRSSSVQWLAPYLPAGTYQLTYRFVPVFAGEFRVLPARAYQYYFPDVQGTSAGSILRIE
jgi:hypothetical protein